ncbi:3-oxoacid CoA-transferase subunit B [Caenimonas soli]|uniref:3-oxoacid CoA-transferase subunit B n=1 Tax=Caenimonas soli TaxID=2735555 RepID=UPI001557BE70|nr:3-oxoacid CoA-transferase subunit B [Caenimonas soli]NPC59323.1 3-oxoacid CoA-transferase subunit B [Caenimonas soli]
MTKDYRQQIAQQVAQDLPDGSYVNLGIGLPTLVANYLPAQREIVFQSENGLLGVGPAPEPGLEDPELVNAGKMPVTLLPGASVFHHADSFMMIRGGHIDFALLGAFQVAMNGDLANWTTGADAKPPAVGGAMDLAAGAKSVWVMMEHCTRDGAPRLLEKCSYPITAAGVVKRIYTELAVIDVRDGFAVTRLADGVAFGDVQKLTAAPLRLELRK